MAAESEATVDTEVDSEVEAENVVYLRQVTKSTEQTNEWSKFVAGHHAELIEMDVRCEVFEWPCLKFVGVVVVAM